MPKRIGEQVIVITGASSGIGLATAREAGRRGARVVLAARNAADLDRAAAEIRRDGGEALAVPTDVAESEQVEELALRAADAFGRIDTWINGAAVINIASFREQPLRDFERVVHVDFMGQVYGAKAALPYLEETDGALVCIGSAYGVHGAPLWSAYSAAKHALKGWLDSLREELAHEGSSVRVTLVKPSAVNTPIFQHAKSQIGVKPRAIPPFYEPEVAADRILRAAEGDERDVYVGAPAALLALGEKVSPRLIDAFMRVAGYRFKGTAQPEPPNAPDNLYSPMPSDGGVHGEFRALPVEPSRTVAAHPVASSLAAAGLGLAAALLLLRL